MTLKAGCTTRETMKTKVGYMGGGTGGEEETRSYLFSCVLKCHGLESPHPLRNAPPFFQTLPFSGSS